MYMYTRIIMWLSSVFILHVYSTVLNFIIGFLSVSVSGLKVRCCTVARSCTDQLHVAMGVRDLWKVLSKAKRRVDIKELRGKTLAVDLSCWMCQFSSVKANSLKNVFYRILHLYSAGVSLVFVVEGAAPSPVKLINDSTENGRENFMKRVRECCELLDSLGIPWLQATGEAEAYCACLDSSEVVSGVLTDDNDAFLYGAKTVYCDLCANEKELSMSVYSMNIIQQMTGLSRVDLVALGLLLGCDYCHGGVPGVGKKLALQLVREWKRKKSTDLLDGFREWRLLQFEEGEFVSKTERYVKSKAMELDKFPDEKIISEYLSPGDEVSTCTNLSTKLQWRAPDLTRFQEFATSTIMWGRDYCLQKCSVLLSEWLKRHPDAPGIISVRTLKMKQLPGSVQSLVEWKVEKFVFKTEDSMVFMSWEDSVRINSYLHTILLQEGSLGKRGMSLSNEDVDDTEEELFFSSMRKRRRKCFRL